MDRSVPDELRFPPAPAAWTRASDEELAAFVDQVVAWAGRVVRALRDDPALATVMTERGRRHFTAALLRQPPPDAEADRFRLALLPAVTAAVRLGFEDIMEWREDRVNFLVLDQDVVDSSYSRRDAHMMRTFLHPVGPERCDVCTLPLSAAHRCPLDKWCDPPPSAGPVRPFPDALRFPAPPEGGTRAPAEQLATFIAAVLAWRGRVVAALQSERDALPDTLTDAAASYVLACLIPDAARAPSWTVPFPQGLTADPRGCERALMWRDRFVGSLFNKHIRDDPQIRTSRDERVLRQFMRPPDGDDRCELCLRRFASRKERWDHRCPARHWRREGTVAGEGPRAADETDA